VNPTGANGLRRSERKKKSLIHFKADRIDDYSSYENCDTSDDEFSDDSRDSSDLDDVNFPPKEKSSATHLPTLKPQGWQEEKWETYFKQLMQFKQRMGHTNVKRSEEGKLGKWVKSQRRSYMIGCLPKYRIDKLERIGFVWDVNEDLWEQRYFELVQFKKEHGHLVVNRQTYPALGYWVKTQRSLYWHSKGRMMSDDRVKRLEDLGFKWKVFKIPSKSPKIGNKRRRHVEHEHD